MCGIVGVMSAQPVDRSKLDSALGTMRQRGPDGQGVWWSEDGCVGLGHRRLAINDPEGGYQPICSSRSISSVNGEFYALPDRYKGVSDSHALSDFYRDFGLDGTLERLRGEFAFLLYDRERKRLVAGRDRFGIKPLFWAQLGQEWWFASTPAALWAAGLAKGWCERSFAHAAATQYPPSGGSLFQGVHSLPPAHALTLSDSQLHVTKYWNLPTTVGGLGSVTDHSDDFRNCLRECVAHRLRKGSRTGVLLSAGVDSSSILALAAQQGEDLKAYTIDFPDSDEASFSEASLATQQARALGVPHTIIPLTAQEMVEQLPAVVRQTGGLVVNGHAVGKWKLSQAVQQDGIKVLLSGEGADELLFGYRHFRTYFGATEQNELLQDPAGLGILVSRTESTVLPPTVPNFFHAKYSLGLKISSFLDLETSPLKAFQESLEVGDPKTTPLEHARTVWLDTALRSYILEILGDGTEMAHSVEGRPPFLDHVLWERCSQMPISIHDGRKELLRHAMKGLVVEEIRKAPKHPFMAPPLGKPLYDGLREKILDVRHPFVEPANGLERLAEVRSLPAAQRLEWEPALLWLLSSYILQESWS
jgi:asparagine synthase (glutamine-hydrolysing)